MTNLRSGASGALASRRMSWSALAIVVITTNAAAQAVDEPTAPEQAVAIEPVARDEAIEERISRILEATGWYRGVEIAVDEGIEQRTSARDLATRTEGTVAVVNRIEVREVIFPQGVPFVRFDETQSNVAPAQTSATDRGKPAASTAEPDTQATSAEGGLGNEISELPQDIANATIPEAASGNLLSGQEPQRDL